MNKWGKVLSVVAMGSLSMFAVAGFGTSSSVGSGNHTLTALKSAARSHSGGKVKTVDFIFTGYAYPYFAPMAQAVKDVAHYYRGLKINIIDANNSPFQEITDIKEAIANKVSGIILNPIDGSVTSAAQEAMNKGIPVVTVDRDVSSPKARVAFIGDNDVQLGKEQTQYAVKYLAAHKIPKPWHVVILQGTLGASVSIGRLAGAMSVLNPLVHNGSVKIVLNQSANFATNTAQTMVSELLSKTTNIQLIVASNDAMALGAITALQTAGVKPGKNTLVVGADAQPESLTAIKNGTQLDTVTHAPFVEAFWAVEAMDNFLTNGAKPPKRKYPNGDIIIPMDLVTKANVNAFAAWGTPKRVPPLPYGRSSAHPVGNPGK
ncbi:MAG: sugar ABC transporter substrate-binding protein [Bacilli bacterium]